MPSQSPLAAHPTRTRNRKRLIVLCDGTWQNSTSDDESAYPSNVTRLARALQRSARVRCDDGTEEVVDQIVHYQQGVGTGVLDRWLAGVTGIGVSAHVRSAYGFLASNYDGDAGDEICFFGFSRGAYVARSVAGLVTAHGLLTKKGMDGFQELYGYYYRKHGMDDPAAEKAFAAKLAAERLLDQSAADAVKVVGVWDTVAFHKTWVASTWIARLLGVGKEYIEFRNAELSDRVAYGFHALALDEHRRSFLPTLWDPPRATAASNLKAMHQVWFSGEHSDIGGGRPDHRLSDIALGWMVSMCRTTGLLEFDDGYLLQQSQKASSSSSSAAAAPPANWDTRLGKTRSDNGVLGDVFWTIAGRLPGGTVDRQPLQGARTNEAVHCSIADRRFGSSEGCAGAAAYPCSLLTGRREDGGWQLRRDPSKRLMETAADAAERSYQGRIRAAVGESIASLGRG